MSRETVDYKTFKDLMSKIPSTVTKESLNQLGFEYDELHMFTEVVEGEIYLTTGPIGSVGSSQLIVLLNDKQARLMGVDKVDDTILYAPSFRNRPTYIIDVLPKTYTSFNELIPVKSITFNGKPVLPKDGLMQVSNRIELPLLQNPAIFQLPDLKDHQLQVGWTDGLFGVSIVYNGEVRHLFEIDTEQFKERDYINLYNLREYVQYQHKIMYPKLTKRADEIISDYGTNFVQELASSLNETFYKTNLIEPSMLVALLESCLNEATLISILNVYEDNKMSLSKAIEVSTEGIELKIKLK